MDSKKTPAIETLAVGLLIIIAGAAFTWFANLAALPTQWEAAAGAVGLVGGGIVGNMGTNYLRALAAGQTVTLADLESWSITAAQNVVTGMLTGIAAHQAAQLVQPVAQPQNTINITTPPSPTSSDSTAITATAGDVAVSMPPVDAPQPIVGDAGQNTTPAIPSPVDVPQPVTSGGVAPSSVTDTPTEITPEAVIYKGTTYVLPGGVL